MMAFLRRIAPFFLIPALILDPRLAQALSVIPARTGVGASAASMMASQALSVRVESVSGIASSEQRASLSRQAARFLNGVEEQYFPPTGSRLAMACEDDQ